jgi:hypothetical protein
MGFNAHGMPRRAAYGGFRRRKHDSIRCAEDRRSSRDEKPGMAGEAAETHAGLKLIGDDRADANGSGRRRWSEAFAEKWLGQPKRLTEEDDFQRPDSRMLRNNRKPGELFPVLDVPLGNIRRKGASLSQGRLFDFRSRREKEPLR